MQHDGGAIERALDEALREQGLHAGFKETIRRLVFDPSDAWRVCCGSACEPCVETMARAIDQVRAAIGWQR